MYQKIKQQGIINNYVKECSHKRSKSHTLHSPIDDTYDHDSTARKRKRNKEIVAPLTERQSLSRVVKPNHQKSSSINFYGFNSTQNLSSYLKSDRVTNHPVPRGNIDMYKPRGGLQTNFSQKYMKKGGNVKQSKSNWISQH